MRTMIRHAAMTTAVVVSGLGLAACGTSSPSAPASRTLNLSFLEDPGNGATDPDIYYAGQGIILQNNVYQGLLQYQGGASAPAIIPDLA